MENPKVFSTACEEDYLEGNKVVAYIALGSNLLEPIRQIKKALQALRAWADIDLLQTSRLYRTVPLILPQMSPQPAVAVEPQPDYINAVVKIATTLPPLILLDALQAIEKNQGRVRHGERWSARVLDLDILLYGEQCLNLPCLTVPHAEMATRDFVLYPLNDLAPELIIPHLGRVSELKQCCENRGLILV